MKQLTKEQAIQLSKIDFSDKFSPVNLAITQLFQDNLFIDANDFKLGLSALFEREIYTHQLNYKLRSEYYKSFPPVHLDRLEAALFSIVSEMETKTNNEYQKGFEAGSAEYKATVLSLERQIEEFKRALEAEQELQESENSTLLVDELFMLNPNDINAIYYHCGGLETEI